MSEVDELVREMIAAAENFASLMSPAMALCQKTATAPRCPEAIFASATAPMFRMLEQAAREAAEKMERDAAEGQVLS